ncbi:hypothetical protein HPB52_013426 [Rhipicephalus sanguineus]|uniref:Sulfotransferase domain-containing protein n=1 Tax=Rhipicephalus sanguineus TaxID=34632 RepID=A0A9D4T5T9_RHISA|nr:hypothetical protein HPB52_013426 [Rhipicephalus sanguineus]
MSRRSLTLRKNGLRFRVSQPAKVPPSRHPHPTPSSEPTAVDNMSRVDRQIIPMGKMNEDSLIQVDGILVNDFLREENVRAAMHYEPGEDDVFIASYPKCGTTWTQYIVCNIFTRGNAPNNVTDFLLQAPYFDFMGADAPKKMPKPGALMTHLPFNMRRHSNKARNPYDCAVSYYHYLLGHTPKTCTDVSFETFVKAFIAGRVPYGDYFDHLLSWYEHRHDPNVLFFTCDSFVNALLELPEEKRLESMEIYRKKGAAKRESHEGSGRVRKGKIGDWKNHFTTPELLDAMKGWINEKTKGTDVMRLWEDLNLP